MCPTPSQLSTEHLPDRDELLRAWLGFYRALEARRSETAGMQHRPYAPRSEAELRTAAVAAAMRRMPETVCSHGAVWPVGHRPC